MYASLTAVLPSDAESSPPSSQEPQDVPAVSNPAPMTANQASAAAAVSGAGDLEKQVAIFEQITKSISTEQGGEDPLCPLYAAAIRQCNLELQRIRARHNCPKKVKPATPLQANGAAPASMSRVRLKSCLEAGRNRSRAPAKPPLSTQSPVKPRAAPFHRPEVVKPVPMKEQVLCQTLRQAQKAKAATTATAARMAKRTARAAKLIISRPSGDTGNRQAISSAPVSIPPLLCGAAKMPSLPAAAAAGKENSTSEVAEHPAGALGGSSAGAGPHTGTTGNWCAAAQPPSQAASAQHLDAQESDQPLKRRRRTARWLSEYDLV